MRIRSARLPTSKEPSRSPRPRISAPYRVAILTTVRESAAVGSLLTSLCNMAAELISPHMFRSLLLAAPSVPRPTRTPAESILGIRAADDRLPPRILKAVSEGGAAGSVPDEDLMRKQYYEIRGMDGRGVPTPQLLKSLNLEFLQKPLASL